MGILTPSGGKIKISIVNLLGNNSYSCVFWILKQDKVPNCTISSVSLIFDKMCCTWITNRTRCVTSILGNKLDVFKMAKVWKTRLTGSSVIVRLFIRSKRIRKFAIMLRTYTLTVKQRCRYLMLVLVYSGSILVFSYTKSSEVSSS